MATMVASKGENLFVLTRFLWLRWKLVFLRRQSDFYFLTPSFIPSSRVGNSFLVDPFIIFTTLKSVEERNFSKPFII